MLESEFETPADFDASEYARGAFGITGGAPELVEVVFDAEIAGYVRERNLAREPDARRGAGRLGAAEARRGTEPRAARLDQGLRAARQGRPPGVAARGDRTRARGSAPQLSAARPRRPLEWCSDEPARDLPQPQAGARLRDRLRLPRVHLPVPDDRPAGLRHDPDPLRARPAVRRAQEPEALPAGASATRAPSTRRSPTEILRRPGRGDRAAPHEVEGDFLRARRHRPSSRRRLRTAPRATRGWPWMPRVWPVQPEFALRLDALYRRGDLAGSRLPHERRSRAQRSVRADLGHVGIPEVGQPARSAQDAPHHVRRRVDLDVALGKDGCGVIGVHGILPGLGVTEGSFRKDRGRKAHAPPFAPSLRRPALPSHPHALEHRGGREQTSSSPAPGSRGTRRRGRAATTSSSAKACSLVTCHVGEPRRRDQREVLVARDGAGEARDVGLDRVADPHGQVAEQHDVGDRQPAAGLERAERVARRPARLSGTRLMTQLLMIASTVPSATGRCSISPRRNSTFVEAALRRRCGAPARASPASCRRR